MTACVKCGHDPDARVLAAWTFTLAGEIRSLNRHVVNFGAARHVYRRERDDWMWLARAARLAHQIPPATGRRRLTLIRIYTRRQRELDDDNLSGGAKPLVDALVRERLLVDDTRRWLELHHDQEHGATRGVRVVLEELADTNPTDMKRGATC